MSGSVIRALRPSSRRGSFPPRLARACRDTARPRAFSSAAASEEALSDAKFLFDLNGFCVVRGVLSAEEVAICNAGIDAHAARTQERTGALRNTADGSALAGDGTAGRRDLGGMLEWEAPYREPFRSMLAHPTLLPYMHALVGRGYRMDHVPFTICQHKGSEGFALHGGSIDRLSGEFSPQLAYTWRNGTMHNALLGVSLQLSDHGEGDGGFCVVRGSHKSNSGMPVAMTNGEAHREHVYQPTTKAGDVVIFSEGTVHGALPWAAEHERRVALYRFAPCGTAYSRAYEHGWPERMLEGMSEEQLAVLEPPYSERLMRPLLSVEDDDGAQTEKVRISKYRRAKYKVEFDKKVFGGETF